MGRGQRRGQGMAKEEEEEGEEQRKEGKKENNYNELKDQLYPTLYNLTDYRVHGILQARIMEWVAFFFSRGSFQHRDQTQVSHVAGGLFTS